MNESLEDLLASTLQPLMDAMTFDPRPVEEVSDDP